MNKRPRAHRPTASEGSASSGGSGSTSGNGSGSAERAQEQRSQRSTTMSAGAIDAETTSTGRGRDGLDEVDSAQDFYESGSDEESRSSSSKRRRSNYEQSRSCAGDATAFLTDFDVAGPLPTIQPRASTSMLMHEQKTSGISSSVPMDSTPPVPFKETCDLTDWEELKLLFVRAVKAFDDDSVTDSQSASTLLHAVLTECNRFLTFYKEPSVLFLPSPRKKNLKGSSPSALTPPDVRLRRDWGVGSGSSSGSGSSGWRSTRGYHTDEEIPPPTPTPQSKAVSTPEIKANSKQRSRRKNNDLPTAFHTLYGTALLLYGILVYRSGSTGEDEMENTPQERVNFASPYGSPMQGISPPPSSPPRFSSVSSTPSQGALSLEQLPRQSHFDSSTHIRFGLGMGQLTQRSPFGPSQPFVFYPSYSTKNSPSGGVSTPSASSTSGATGTGSTTASNIRPISSRTSSSASTSYFSIPVVHRSPTWTSVMPLIPATRSAFTSPADPRLTAHRKLRYPPSYYWLAALDVFAAGEAVTPTRAGLDLALRQMSSSLDASSTVHDPFFLPAKQRSTGHKHSHSDTYIAHSHRADLTAYEFPSDTNPFLTSFSSKPSGSHEFAVGASFDSKIREEAAFGIEDSGTSVVIDNEERKRKRKRDKPEKGEAEKDNEDWRLPVGWGRTLVCLADEKASMGLRERERSAALTKSEGSSNAIHGEDVPAFAVPTSFFFSSFSSEYHARGREPSPTSTSPSSSPEPVTVTTPNGSTKNMVASQTPSSRKAQLLRDSAHHLLVLAVDQFTRGMLYMPRRTKNELSTREAATRTGNEEDSSRRPDDPNVDTPFNLKTASDESATSPASTSEPTHPQITSQSSSLSSPVGSDSPPPSLSALLSFSRTRTLVSIADAVLDVAAKLSVPDDRAYWGRWVDGILDVDTRMGESAMNTPFSGPLGSSGFGFGFPSMFSSASPGSMSVPSGIEPMYGSSPVHNDVFAVQSTASDDEKGQLAPDKNENDKLHEEKVDASYLRAGRMFARARAWLLMGTAINEGTPERIRKGEEREARDALRKAIGFLEDGLSEIEKFKSLVDEGTSMSTTSSGETVTQENVNLTPISETNSPPEADVALAVYLERWKAKVVNLEKNSRNLIYDTYAILISLVDEEPQHEPLLSKARELEAFLSPVHQAVTLSPPPKTNDSTQTESSQGEEVNMDCDSGPLPNASGAT